MSETTSVLKGAEPYSASGDRRGALVLHGFTGSPQSMRPMGEAFAQAGLTVEMPRLPGHGTTVEDMVQYRFSDWAKAAEAAYVDLASRTDSIVIAGLSMGGTLTLWLAARHPEIKAIILVNPAVQGDDFAPFVEGANATIASGGVFLPGVAGDIADPNAKELGYDKAPAACLLSLVEAMGNLKSRLPEIKAPALVMRSVQDHIIPPGSVELLRDQLGGPVEFVELAKSFHVATIDYDGPDISRRAVEFAER
jgi:carboxylesterase